MHFGEGERLFYGQVQDAAVPIRQALAHHPEAGSSWAVPNAQIAPDDAPPSPREPDRSRLHSRDLHMLGAAIVLHASCQRKMSTGGQHVHLGRQLPGTEFFFVIGYVAAIACQYKDALQGPLQLGSSENWQTQLGRLRKLLGRPCCSCAGKNHCWHCFGLTHFGLEHQQNIRYEGLWETDACCQTCLIALH